MKKLIDLYKNFKYKNITAIGLSIITQILFIITQLNIFGFLSIFFFVYLSIFLTIYIYHALENHKKDGDKNEWIILSIIVYAFYAGLIGLIVTKVIIPFF